MTERYDKPERVTIGPDADERAGVVRVPRRGPPELVDNIEPGFRRDPDTGDVRRTKPLGDWWGDLFDRVRGG